jgi:hypothetical protein
MKKINVLFVIAALSLLTWSCESEDPSQGFAKQETTNSALENGQVSKSAVSNSIRNATLIEFEDKSIAAYCGNSFSPAVFNLLSANPQLLAGLNPDDYTISHYRYEGVGFGPPRRITPLTSFADCGYKAILVDIRSKKDFSIYFTGRITLVVQRTN